MANWDSIAACCVSAEETMLHALTGGMGNHLKRSVTESC